MIQKVGHIARIHPLDKPISAIVNVPGSKSYTNRALIMAALAEGVSTLRGISDSNDSKVPKLFHLQLSFLCQAAIKE